MFHSGVSRLVTSQTPPTHFSLDHVDASGAQGLDTVVDVHHSLALGHIQHDVQHDVAAGPARPHAGFSGSRSREGRSAHAPVRPLTP